MKSFLYFLFIVFLINGANAREALLSQVLQAMGRVAFGGLTTTPGRSPSTAFLGGKCQTITLKPGPG